MVGAASQEGKRDGEGRDDEAGGRKVEGWAGERTERGASSTEKREGE
jgi:hypothetical protein